MAPTQPFAPVAKSPRGRFPLLAASIAGAAAIGSIAGAGAFTLAGKLFEEAPAVTTAKTEPTEEIRELRERVAQLRSGLKALLDSVGGLKGALEASSKTNAAQLAKVSEQVTRIGEGVDRTEKAQAEPAARLSKAVEALERLDRRAAPPETTGSVPARPDAPKAAIVEGWVLRRVVDGVAIVEGRDRIVEVLPGDTIRGVGRVDDIRRQDGRWVVVTAKGLITTAR
jgi:hypothetical protein